MAMGIDVKINDEIKKRFMDKIAYEPMSGCWLYSDAHIKGGYGHFSIKGKTIKAHRMSFLIHNGPIPIGLQVNHKCDVRCCVNPEHLWIGTQKENISDASQKGRMQEQKKTHCPQGHEYSLANTIKRKRGSRECKICVAVQQKRIRSSKKHVIAS